MNKKNIDRTQSNKEEIQPTITPNHKHGSAPDGALEHRIEVPVLNKLIAILTKLLLSAAIALWTDFCSHFAHTDQSLVHQIFTQP